MPSIRTTAHVEFFLGPINPTEMLVTFTERLFGAAETDDVTAKSVRHGLEFVEHQRVELQRRITRAGGGGRLVDDTELDLLAVSHLRLGTLLPATGFSSQRAIKDVAKPGANTFERFTDSIEEDFFFELGRETERRALMDPQFRTELRGARDAVTKAGARLEHLSRTSKVVAESRVSDGGDAQLSGAMSTFVVVATLFVYWQIGKITGAK